MVSRSRSQLPLPEKHQATKNVFTYIYKLRNKQASEITSNEKNILVLLNSVAKYTVPELLLWLNYFTKSKPDDTGKKAFYKFMKYAVRVYLSSQLKLTESELKFQFTLQLPNGVNADQVNTTCIKRLTAKFLEYIKHKLKVNDLDDRVNKHIAEHYDNLYDFIKPAIVLLYFPNTLTKAEHESYNDKFTGAFNIETDVDSKRAKNLNFFMTILSNISFDNLNTIRPNVQFFSELKYGEMIEKFVLKTNKKNKKKRANHGENSDSENEDEDENKSNSKRKRNRASKPRLEGIKGPRMAVLTDSEKNHMLELLQDIEKYVNYLSPEDQRTFQDFANFAENKAEKKEEFYPKGHKKDLQKGQRVQEEFKMLQRNKSDRKVKHTIAEYKTEAKLNQVKKDINTNCHSTSLVKLRAFVASHYPNKSPIPLRHPDESYIKTIDPKTGTEVHVYRSKAKRDELCDHIEYLRKHPDNYA